MLISANAALIREVGSFNQTVTNVIYTNGRIDPWLYTGIEHSREPHTTAMTIESNFSRLRFEDFVSLLFFFLAYSKSADLTSMNRASDTAILIQAKELIKRTVIEWSIS